MRWGRAFACVALLSLLTGHAREIPAAPAPYSGPTLPLKDTSGWALWYEDESYEDCGTEPPQKEGTCSDNWGMALGYRFPSEEACKEVSFDYNKRSKEEFKCAQTKPEEKQDDYASPNSP